jgi:hypothetical protein
MVLYNVTISVDPQKSADWLHYMRSEHIPDVMATGAFRDFKICRIHAEEEGGETFAVQYVAWSQESFKVYQDSHAAGLQAQHAAKFGDCTAAFRTVLSILEEGAGKGASNGENP